MIASIFFMRKYLSASPLGAGHCPLALVDAGIVPNQDEFGRNPLPAAKPLQLGWHAHGRLWFRDACGKTCVETSHRAFDLLSKLRHRGGV
ncbi:hypothetical protein J2858_002502 [Neorhizobium galegae]|uniref:hypothetical protein n=1 Tax=Neorhizobium galegae TaxID=399 RepID=UPI001AE38AD1|nr:hypothetical protein [Neorhizobium galegae]MBP2549579.1 hypothetical protein [Neorhizobium galegae]